MGLSRNNQDRDTLLEVLEDPEGFKKRLEQLEKAESNLQETIKLVGPAENIPRLHEAAAAAKSEATKTLREAQEEAESLVEEAEQKARDIVANAEAEKSRIELAAFETKGEADAVRAEAADDRRGVDEAMAEVVRNRNEILAVQTSLDRRAADLDSQQNQLLQEKSKLATVREQIDQFLR